MRNETVLAGPARHESARAMFQASCNEMLANAALAGDLNEIGRYLQAGAEVDAGEGAALRYAVRGGHANAVRRLLEAGANPDARYGEPLLVAAERGDATVVRALLDAGADPTIRDGEAMVRAVEARSLSVVQRLIDAGAPVSGQGGMALCIAARTQQTQVAAILLQAGADPSARDSEAVWEAVRTDNEDLLEICLAAGASLRTRNECQALVQAVELGRGAMYRRMVEAGAEPDQHAEDLLVAAARGGPGMIDVVLTDLRDRDALEPYMAWSALQAGINAGVPERLGQLAQAFSAADEIAGGWQTMGEQGLLLIGDRNDRAMASALLATMNVEKIKPSTYLAVARKGAAEVMDAMASAGFDWDKVDLSGAPGFERACAHLASRRAAAVMEPG